MPEHYITIPGEKGSVHISEDVIAVIVGSAISEVEGVAGLTGAGGPDFSERLGFKSLSRGVGVSFEGGRVRVDASIHVRYGASIAQVGALAQKAAAAAVESMTGLDSTINIHVAGVSFEK
ncbi:MAG: Asp23/Gls24 family envelope stress response protein [Oscillospiraceae bacterium]|nr:Asp23/Gls24 family envelope stress response protein [Oscillospiraceae bacterium]